MPVTQCRILSCCLPATQQRSECSSLVCFCVCVQAFDSQLLGFYVSLKSNWSHAGWRLVMSTKSLRIFFLSFFSFKSSSCFIDLTLRRSCDRNLDICHKSITCLNLERYNAQEDSSVSQICSSDILAIHVSGSRVWGYWPQSYNFTVSSENSYLPLNIIGNLHFKYTWGQKLLWFSVPFIWCWWRIRLN